MAKATKGDGFVVTSLTVKRGVTMGGGSAGSATSQSAVTKAVTAFTDTTAKDVFTVTVPNAKHAAMFELDLLGVLGAGGAIGAGEAVMAAKYVGVIVRTAGKAVVADLSTEITGGSALAKVAGGDDITSVVASLSTITGGVTATNTFTIKVAITRSGSGATAHTLVAAIRLLNQNATGVTIA